MKPDRAHIDLAFPHPILGQFFPVKLHLEYPLGPTDHEHDALDAGKKSIEEWFASRYPALDMGFNSNGQPPKYEQSVTSSTLPTISKDKERVEIAIDNAKTIDDLRLLNEDAGKNGLVSHYVKRFNELNNVQK